jgi:hypothetical protein
MSSPLFERLKSSGAEAAEFLGNVQPVVVNRSPEPLPPGADDYACWIWQGPAGSKGFAYDSSEPIARRAHSLLVGPIPPGKFVKRECGNRLCVNPRHLLLTTPEKIGAESAGKLTPEERDQALAALEAGESQCSVARRFGITQPAVAALKKRANSEEQPRTRHMAEWLDKQTGRLGLVGQLARGAEMPAETLDRALELATREWTAHQGLFNEYETRRRSAAEQGEVAWE